MKNLIVFRKVVKSPVERIVEFYGTLDLTKIYVEAAATRKGTEHEEVVDGDAVFCAVCGKLDSNIGNPIYHPAQYVR